MVTGRLAAKEKAHRAGLWLGHRLSVLEICQQRLAHQEVFVLTNMSSPYVRSRCLALGVDAVFDKTTEVNKFFERCKNLKAFSH
ncbi:hypothetical protein [Polaromonas hydrogenivorans]|uniref:hypothetical protein n=1 Tax=Polaromonas hydrogenivorans TaxID=335476 RepID=UPI0039EEE950